MNFKVYIDQDGHYDDYEGEVTCFLEHGALFVDDGKRHVLYGPNGWTRVESDRTIRSVGDETVDVRLTEMESLGVWINNDPLIVSGPQYRETSRRGR